MRTDEIENMLDDAIIKAIENLEKAPVGSEERLKAVREVETLYRARDNQYKADAEYRTTIEAKELELKGEDDERTHTEVENRKNRTAGAVSTAANLSFWALMFHKVLKFEETGVVTSTIFRVLIKAIRLF